MCKARAAIRQDRSWWILRKLETEPPRPMTFEEARTSADHAVGNERIRQLQEQVETHVRQLIELTLSNELPPS